MKIIFLITLLILQPFQYVVAVTTSPIIFTEISAFESSGYEWVEVYNTSNQSIDLSTWKFYENETHHGLNTGGLILNPGEYAIIADEIEKFKSKHSDLSCLMVDSSWDSLLESGENIGLKNSEGVISLEFSYPEAKDSSIQLINIDQPIEISNWKEVLDEQSPCHGYSQSSSTPVENFNPNEVKKLTKPSLGQGVIQINELYTSPAKGDHEWVELYNTTSTEISLDNWYFLDGADNPYYIEDVIEGFGYKIIEFEKNWLNNAGDALYIYDQNKNLIDFVSYGNWNDDNSIENNAEGPNKEESLASLQRQSINNDSSKTFLVTKLQTPGEKNEFEDVELEIKNEKPQIQKTSVKIKKGVVIKEVLANPIGSDLYNEFIELENISNEPINIKDWVIKINNESRYIILNITLLPNLPIAFYRKDTKLAIDNSGDKINIFSNTGENIDELNLPNSSLEGSSYSLFEDGWKFSTLPTPFTVNILQLPNISPIIKASCNENENKIYCDSSDSYDPNGENLRFIWSLKNSDDKLVYQVANEVAVFDKKDDIKIELKISDINSDSQKVIYSNSSYKIATSESKPVEPVSKLEKIVEKEIKIEGTVTKINKASFYIQTLDNDSQKVTVDSDLRANITLLQKNDYLEVSGVMKKVSDDNIFEASEFKRIEKPIEKIPDTPLEEKKPAEIIDIPLDKPKKNIPTFIPLIVGGLALGILTLHTIFTKQAWRARLHSLFWKLRIKFNKLKNMYDNSQNT